MATATLERREIQIPQGAKIGTAQEPIYGYETRPAYCASGLAVHKTGKGARWKWMVTHEASGFALGVLGAMTKARAVENMQAALTLDFDWTRNERDTIAALRQSRGIVDAMRKIGESQ